jgi:hypothetical protein
MAELAGVSNVQFKSASGESGGHVTSVAPNVVVLSPSALKLEACRSAFLVEHEIVQSHSVTSTGMPSHFQCIPASQLTGPATAKRPCNSPAAAWPPLTAPVRNA